MTVLAGNVHVSGVLTAKLMIAPDGSVSDAAINAGISGEKLEHQFALYHQQAPGSNVVAATEDCFIAKYDGELLALEAALTGQVPSVDRVASVDVQKSTGGGAFATVLTGTLDLDNTTVIREKDSGAINSAAFVAGDIFRFVITVSGSSGDHPQGLIAVLHVREDGQ